MHYFNKVILSSFIFLLIPGLSSCADSTLEKNLLYISDSPSGLSHLAIYSDEPMAFSSSHIYLHYSGRKVGGYKPIFRGAVSNDGVSLGQSNVTIRWKDDKHAELILSGQEQSDDYYEINLENKPTVTPKAK